MEKSAQGYVYSVVYGTLQLGRTARVPRGQKLGLLRVADDVKIVVLSSTCFPRKNPIPTRVGI